MGLRKTLLALAVIAAASGARCADVVIDPAQTFQTIVGWGHGGGIIGGTSVPLSMLGATLADPVNYQYLDYLVDDLGLTGSRTWEIGPRIDGTGNDHGDCDVVDWNLFQVDSLDAANAHYLVYFQNRLLAKGIQPSFYSSPGYPTHASDQKPWVMSHPGERAQQIWASALAYQTNYGLNISYAVIYNEPSMSYTILADDAKALGPRFTAQGLATRVQYAEAVAPQTDWGYFTPVLNDPDLWPNIGRVSYHDYGTADPYRTFLRDYGRFKGLTTAQTEMGNPSYDDLFADLTLAGVSYWEVAYSASLTLTSNPGLTAFTPAARFFRLRQLLHYVRPGAVRIGALSSDPSIRALAFSSNGVVTTIIENTSGSIQTVNLSGLPPGVYGLSQSAGSPFQEFGLRTVGPNGMLTITNVLGGSTAATLYPYAGPNHPPTIEVWGANPGYLAAPTNTATLSVTASDPELDPLTYHWSVNSQPAGANAVLASPNAASTSVSGLTVPGTYIFNLNVMDGVNTSSKLLYLVVYDSNPPPVLGQAGFRIAAPYGLVFDDPGAMTRANIELPTSSATLQVGISDLANSDFTGRGHWSVVSQPPGASVTLGPTTNIFVSIRADVSGMTVTGDYVYQVNVTNPGHPDLTAQIVCTVYPATSAPVINSISAVPPGLTLPASSTQLSAVTTGSTNQPLRHWWAVKTAPPGARPVFDHQGATNTTVSNLILPGTYTFTLRVFDDIHMTTQDKPVTVTAAPGAPVITSAASASVIVGTPFSYTITASNSPASLNATALPPGLGFNNGVISGTPTAVGTFNLGLAAVNASGTGYGNLALTVKLPLPVITSAATADGMTNKPFACAIATANLGTIFGAANLPVELTLDSSSGLITGTPTSSGVYNVTLGATNTTGSATAPLTLVIYNGPAAAPGITSGLTATATAGLGFNYLITASNNPTGFFAIGLPAGLSFDPADGRIFGAASVTGTFPVTIRAVNRGGAGSATLALTVSPAPPPVISAFSMQNGFNLSFLTLTNRFYGVQWTGDLLDTNWADLTNGIPGNSATQTVTDPFTDAPVRLYRIEVSPP